MDREHLLRDIESGLAALRMEPAPGLADVLANYLALLEQWNQAYNLTAVRRTEEMVSRHVLDSLAVLPFIGDGRVLDVGTGAGLPGLVLAATRPDQCFVLLDSSGKKTRFVEHAVRQLGLENVTVVRDRVEEYRDGDGFDVVVSRAFSSLKDFVDRAGHLVGPGGRLLAMKGELPAEELARLPEDWRLCGLHRLAVPGLEADRHLLEFLPGKQRP